MNFSLIAHSFIFSPPHLIRKKRKKKQKTLSLHTSLQTQLAHTHGPHVNGANPPHAPARAEDSRSPRGRVTPRPGQQAQAQLCARRGPGTGLGDPQGGRGRGRWPWCRILRATGQAPLSPEARTHRRGKERKRPHHWLEFLEARAVFTQNTKAEPYFLSAALASPLPIFDLLLEGPVPPPRVPGVGTLVKSSWRPVSPATVPWRAPALPRRI